MGSTLFRDPQARSSALAALGTPQPRALRSLNRIDPLDSVSNYYLYIVLYTVKRIMLSYIVILLLSYSIHVSLIIGCPTENMKVSKITPLQRFLAEPT